ncbi:MAG: trigger factor [Clostridia bacterium]|nr:trigger factor [Clostridia bacterium]
MKYKVTSHKNNEVALEVTLSAEEWDKEVENAYNKHKGEYPVEGFRKGRVPRKVIEKTYGPTVFFEEALAEGFGKAYSEVLAKEKDIDPVDAPELSVKSLDEKGVVITAVVPVMPEVKLGAYKGLKISHEPRKITAKDVDVELERVREQNVRYVEKQGAIENGDIANIDFKGFKGNVQFDGGTAEAYDLEIGSHSFIEGFEEQLVGKKAGDEVDVKVTFPKEYQAKELAGQPAVFKVKVNVVKSKELPELNDAFASDVSEFETLAAYKEHIKEHLGEHAQEDAKIQTENEIIEKIVAGMQVDVPNALVETELNNIMQDMEYRLMYQGLKLEDYAKYLGKSLDELREGRRADALKGVKVRLAMQEIVKQEKLEVSKEELEAKIKDLAKSAKKTIKEYKESLSEDRISYIKNDILLSKLLAFLVENNK